MLELQRLTRRYGDLIALDGPSFTVAEGQLFGFVRAQRRRQDQPPCASSSACWRPTQARSDGADTDEGRDVQMRRTDAPGGHGLCHGVVPDPPVLPRPGPAAVPFFPPTDPWGMTKLERIGVVATGPLQMLLTAASMVAASTPSWAGWPWLWYYARCWTRRSRWPRSPARWSGWGWPLHVSPTRPGASGGRQRSSPSCTRVKARACPGGLPGDQTTRVAPGSGPRRPNLQPHCHRRLHNSTANPIARSCGSWQWSAKDHA